MTHIITVESLDGLPVDIDIDLAGQLHQRQCPSYLLLILRIMNLVQQS